MFEKLEKLEKLEELVPEDAEIEPRPLEELFDLDPNLREQEVSIWIDIEQLV